MRSAGKPERTMIAISGCRLRISGIASSPSMSGSERSRRTAAGLVSEIPSSALRPSPASPTTSNSAGSSSIPKRIRARSSGTASTRKTEIFPFRCPLRGDIASTDRGRPLATQLAGTELDLAVGLAEQLGDDLARVLERVLDRRLALAVLALVERVLRHREPLDDVVVDLEG